MSFLRFHQKNSVDPSKISEITSRSGGGYLKSATATATATANETFDSFHPSNGRVGNDALPPSSCPRTPSIYVVFTNTLHNT